MDALRAVLRAIWAGVPEDVRRRPSVIAGRRRALRLLHRVGVAPSSPRRVETLAELDEVLARLDELDDDDALRAAFETFSMAPPTRRATDPFSEAYRHEVLADYAAIHGAPYAPTNEVSTIDVAAAADRPFPYRTGSPRTVGDQLIAVGHLIKTMDLAPGSRVVEFGPGWGNTTTALVRMGYEVTAIDVERSFLDLIELRTQRMNMTVRTVHGDFSAVGELDATFDAAIFFESFHHAGDHQALLRLVAPRIAPDGMIVFADEPISDTMPYPWGLRLDGESLWAIRRQGWLELGFQERYFRSLLDRLGWSFERHRSADSRWADVVIARRLAR